MANKYIYSRQAESDLKNIYFHSVQEWGFEQADKYDAGLEEAVNRIAKFPNSGRQCDEVKTGYRRFEYKRHIIFYRVRDGGVYVVRILHDRMDAMLHV